VNKTHSLTERTFSHQSNQEPKSLQPHSNRHWPSRPPSRHEPASVSCEQSVHPSNFPTSQHRPSSGSRMEQHKRPSEETLPPAKRAKHEHNQSHQNHAEQKNEIKKPSYQCKWILKGHAKSISSVKFSPDGKWLATSCTLTLIYWLTLLKRQTRRFDCGILSRENTVSH